MSPVDDAVPADASAVRRGWLIPAIIGSAMLMQTMNATVIANALPTMAGAFAYDLLKSYKFLTFDDGVLIGVGFVAAFISALIVVRSFLDFVSKRGFALFAWWRIIVGMVGLAGLWVVG